MQSLRVLIAFIMTTAFYSTHADEKIAVDIIIEGDYLLTFHDSENSIDKGAVAILADKIIAVDTQQIIHSQYSSATIIPGKDRILMPGLINAHTHSAMTLFRGLADDKALMDWLHNYIFPMEATFVNPAFIKTGAELACYEMIRTGTTTFIDMYFYPRVIAQVTERCGLRAIIAAPIIDFPSPGFQGFDDSFADALDFVKHYKHVDNRIIPAFGPHAPYTVAPDHLKAISASAKALSAPVVMHLAESSQESAIINKRYKHTPITHASLQGLLGNWFIAAHGVHADTQDINLLSQQSSIGVVHNPSSNMKLTSGAAPITDYLKANIKVALGTDGAASNNTLDIFHEIRLASFLQKHETQDPESLPALTSLLLATRIGAEAVGMGNIIGQIAPGFQADMIQIAIDPLVYQPIYDPISHLVYVVNSRDVVTSVVAGNILMKNKQVLTLDKASIRKTVKEIQDKIIHQINTKR